MVNNWHQALQHNYNNDAMLNNSINSHNSITNRYIPDVGTGEDGHGEVDRASTFLPGANTAGAAGVDGADHPHGSTHRPPER